MKCYFFTFTFSLISWFSFSQVVLPIERATDWSIAGLKNDSIPYVDSLNVLNYGLVGNGTTANDDALEIILNANPSVVTLIYFPEGNYLFQRTIKPSSNIILKGSGNESTLLTLDMTSGGHGIEITGTSTATAINLTSSSLKNEITIEISDASSFSVGDWIQLTFNDSSLVLSDWAIGSVGQILQIENINSNQLTLQSPLRMDYLMTSNPKVYKLYPISNVGIECMKIIRIDNTAPEQTCNISFNLGVNCWVKNCESNYTNYAHIEAKRSSNLLIYGNYFHESLEYGGNGRGYGVMLHFTTNECLVYNNIFKHLRHSMILQAGANGNVFAYNFSKDAYWTGTSLPADAAGDLVLHGNYPYLNLFEQNIAENCVIDNSHGSNGPHNTIFRNRLTKFGVFFSDTTSPSQNIIGNEITNTSSPYSFVNYLIQGTDHFLYGNNDKGTIKPTGTSSLSEDSYHFHAIPEELSTPNFGGIGTPNTVGSNSIPAKTRYDDSLFVNCNPTITEPNLAVGTEIKNNSCTTFSNPMNKEEIVVLKNPINTIQIYDLTGGLVYDYRGQKSTMQLPKDITTGVYYIHFKQNELSCSQKLFVK